MSKLNRLGPIDMLKAVMVKTQLLVKADRAFVALLDPDEVSTEARAELGERKCGNHVVDLSSLGILFDNFTAHRSNCGRLWVTEKMITRLLQSYEYVTLLSTQLIFFLFNFFHYKNLKFKDIWVKSNVLCES
jgi:hypothetical protein